MPGTAAPPSPLFSRIYQLAKQLDRADLDELMSVHPTVNVRWTYHTPVSLLASEGHDQAVALLTNRYGADPLSKTFGYAIRGDQRYAKLPAKPEAEIKIVFGRAIAGDASLLLNNHYRIAYGTFMARGYAIGGHHELVDQLLNYNPHLVCDVVYGYAMGGYFPEATALVNDTQDDDSQKVRKVRSFLAGCGEGGHFQELRSWLDTHIAARTLTTQNINEVLRACLKGGHLLLLKELRSHFNTHYKFASFQPLTWKFPLLALAEAGEIDELNQSVAEPKSYTVDVGACYDIKTGLESGQHFLAMESRVRLLSFLHPFYADYLSKNMPHASRDWKVINTLINQYGYQYNQAKITLLLESRLFFLLVSPVLSKSGFSLDMTFIIFSYLVDCHFSRKDYNCFDTHFNYFVPRKLLLHALKGVVDIQTEQRKYLPPGYHTRACTLFYDVKSRNRSALISAITPRPDNPILQSESDPLFKDVVERSLQRLKRTL